MEVLAVTIQDTGGMTSLGKTKICELLANGQLKRVKVGRRTLVTTESIRLLIYPSAI
jgi:hypothetical protein